MPNSNITKKLLASCFKDLMEEQSFEKITVGDICERCEMSRKSFYYHFRDKYDLASWIFYTEFVEQIPERDYESAWTFFEDLCQYLYENRRFYIKALQYEGPDSLVTYFTETLHPMALRYIGEQFKDANFCEFYTVFFSDAVSVAIVRWLKEDAVMPPAEFVDMLKRAMLLVAKRTVADLDPDDNLI